MIILKIPCVHLHYQLRKKQALHELRFTGGKKKVAYSVSFKIVRTVKSKTKVMIKLKCSVACNKYNFPRETVIAKWIIIACANSICTNSKPLTCIYNNVNNVACRTSN